MNKEGWYKHEPQVFLSDVHVRCTIKRFRECITFPPPTTTVRLKSYRAATVGAKFKLAVRYTAPITDSLPNGLRAE